MSAGWLPPLGFLALMLGFGLRLDSTWDGLGGILLAAGAVTSAFALVGSRAPRDGGASRDGHDAFPSDDETR